MHTAWPTQQEMRELRTAALLKDLVVIFSNPCARVHDFSSAFMSAKRMRVDAVMVLLSPGFYVRRERVAESALKAKLPTMFQNDAMVQAGGLMSYGTSFRDTWGRAAYFVDRIINSADPGDLPVEQVSKFS